MRKIKFVISFTLALTLILGAVLNTTVVTRQGINYKTFEIEIPLYLKILNFYDRHFNYKWLVRRVTKNLKTKEEKVFRLFQWTYETIQRQPESLPIIDDHVWNVFLRGYGVDDNFHDLFTTLCNYVGVDSFLLRVKNKNSNEVTKFSLVQTQRGWVIFDPFEGVYFTNEQGDWATIKEIKEQNWKLRKLGGTKTSDSFYYPFFKHLPEIKKMGYQRANLQSPMNRFKYQLNKLLP